MYIFMFTVTTIIGGYFAFRYFSIANALKETNKELKEIQKDLSKNRILHLPLPDQNLENLLISMNTVLEETHKERKNYEKREKEFQKQIENISHDLRTPLTVILGYLKLLEDPDDNLLLNEELTATLKIIRQKAQVMEKLVSQFYAFSRLTADDDSFIMRKTDINKILRETLLGNYQILEESGIRVDAGLPDFPIWVWSDETALERIFSNLFQNAGRYVDSFLKIHIEESRTEIRICFENDAKSLSDQELPHLFDRFYMQDYSRSRGGTGLGLTIAKFLAEKTGGSLTAKRKEMPFPSKTTEDLMVLCFELCVPRCKNI